MRIISIEETPFHEIAFLTSGPGRKPKKNRLPFYKARVDALPQGVSAFAATSDLQGRELGPQNRLLGELAAEELAALVEMKEIPPLAGVILAGDLFEYPDCSKLGGTGDVTPVWNAFARNFPRVVGVNGNHDNVQTEELENNVSILDGKVTSGFGFHIGGVSGIVGQENRNERKTESTFREYLQKISRSRTDILVLHQGPDDPPSGGRGEPLIREFLSRTGSGLVIFGHCYWEKSLVEIGNYQALNVDSKLFVFEGQSV